jgi:hypothetical protein
LAFYGIVPVLSQLTKRSASLLTCQVCSKLD